MLEPSNNAQLPEIPSKRYFTIGEVSELCDVKPHVLRYWEQEFPQLKPVKRRGNRRYYQRQDVMIIRTIRSLLYEQGYTIGGARLQLTDVRQAEVIDEPEELEPVSALPTSGNGIFQIVVKDMIRELEQVANLLTR
jgi:DNA-binding transcriptional MerR regulator